MKYRILLIKDKADLDVVNRSTDEGWTPMKAYSNNDSYIIQLSQGEEEEKRGEFDDVIDVKAVDFDDVGDMVIRGYIVQSIYAKNVIMIRRMEVKKEK